MITGESSFFIDVRRVRRWPDAANMRSRLRIFFASIMERINPREEAGHESAFSMLNEPVRIILIDDDADDRELFEEAISKINTNIQVRTVDDGRGIVQLLDQVTANNPDIIFLDLNMPGKNGKDCLHEIRNHEKGKKVPVIIYSTSANAKDIQDTYLGGANLYLLKPNSFRELIAIIQKAFSIDWEKHIHPPKTHFVISAGSI